MVHLTSLAVFFFNSLVLLEILDVRFSTCNGLKNTVFFQSPRTNKIKVGHGSHTTSFYTSSDIRSATACHVAVNPLRNENSINSSPEFKRTSKSNRYYNNKGKPRKKIRKKEDVWSSGRWDRAEVVEAKLLSALEVLQQSLKLNGDRRTSAYLPLTFPGTRECNAALAAFGDGGDLLRALRMFVKMRKAVALAQRFGMSNGILPRVPAPTLVTYSTLMSRALYLAKPLVALRLWRLMRMQTAFFTNQESPCTTAKGHPSSFPESYSTNSIVPDVKAANILMNCYAKLGEVDKASNLLDQMWSGEGPDVPRLAPNLVTYNTLLDACHKAGDLDAALQGKEQLEQVGLRPDARTYTILIATVARKASSVSGAHDPTLAFSFLQEMVTCHVRPNGMTYSALIDVCGRCGRVDLALKGLRTMLDQKAQEKIEIEWGSSRSPLRENSQGMNKHYTLPSEVGAWTSAINACGKTGRIDTALKLFYAMPKFGVLPNTVTCGCMTDCLLKNGRTAETLEVLRYMKKHSIAPSEVMYTSLMTSAVKLVQFEKNKVQDSRTTKTDRATLKQEAFPVDESGTTKAIEVYTELIKSLTQSSGPQKGSRRHQQNQNDATRRVQKKASSWREDSNEVLLKVFLVFQEMKAVGAQPDLACYNALLRTCAQAGDVVRAQEVLNEILNTKDLEPNDISWREMIRAAGIAGRSDIAMSTWKTALVHHNQGGNDPTRSRSKWNPSIESLSILVMALTRSASDDSIDKHTRRGLYSLVVKLFDGVITSDDRSDDEVQEHPWGMHLIDKDQMFHKQRIMLSFLQAIVNLEREIVSNQKLDQTVNQRLRDRGVFIVKSKCFEDGLPSRIRYNDPARRAYDIGQSWAR